MSRIGLIGENSIEYVDSLLKIWNDGNCAVLIDYRIPINTAIDMMHECNSQECYIDEKIYMGLTDEQLGSINFIPYKCTNNKTAFLPFSTYDKFQSNYSKNEAVIIYSSGTTGSSKGVILSHYAINKNADDIISYMHLDASDIMYIVKTMSHASTLTGELLVCLKTRAKLLVAPIVVPPRVTLSNIKKYKITIVCVNPYLLSIISEESLKGNHDISSIRAIYVSGSILNQNLYIKAHEALENIPIYNVYGMSETGPRLAAQRNDCCKSNSVGRPIGAVQIQVVDEKGAISPIGESGVVHIKTDCLFSGYVRGELKHKSLLPEWFNTGDVGFIDSNLELHIEGRIDDVIIIDSHKIYPSAIEEQVLKILDVIDCAVVGIQIDDQTYLGCLYVGMIELCDLRKRLIEFLPSYEIPKLIVTTDKIPRNNNGKIDKQKVCNAINERKK